MAMNCEYFVIHLQNGFVFKQDGTPHPRFLLATKIPSFHCQEVSRPISPSQRAERDAMRRAAQRQREEAAKVTSKGLDSGVLADRIHLPILWHPEPWLTRPKEDLAIPGIHSGPRSFHCRDVSKPISLLQRAEREALKREAQRQRGEAARITSKGLDCGVLADRVHLPIVGPQLTTPQGDLVVPEICCGQTEAGSNSRNLDQLGFSNTVVHKDQHQEISTPLSPSQRAEREAMKREAQRQREKAARVTSKGLDCSVLADRLHLPILWHPEPQLTIEKDNRFPTGHSCLLSCAHLQTVKTVEPRSFHCEEVSKPISLFQRAEREALKREAQRQREEAARVTRKSLNYRKHFPVMCHLEPELITAKEDLAGLGNECCYDDNVTGRKRKGNFNQSDNKSAENPSKRMKILVGNMTRSKVCVAKLNPGNRPHGPKKLGEKNTAVSSIPIRPRWKWTKVDSTQGKSSFEKKPCPYQGQRKMGSHPVRPHQQKLNCNTHRQRSPKANPPNRGLKNSTVYGRANPVLPLNTSTKSISIKKGSCGRPKGSGAHAVSKASQPAPRRWTRSLNQREV